VTRVLVLVVAILGFCVAAPAALGKGPIQATIDGAGLDSPLQIGSWDNWGEDDALAPQQPIMQLAEAAGFFAAAFGQDPDHVLARRPSGALGPRYVIEYGVPGPENDRFVIVQHLYPYAEPDPVTYMPPGQPLFETNGTRGGWFVATATLEELLVDAGLPASDPTTGAPGDDSRWTVLGPLLVLAVIALSGALAFSLVRRRPQAA
jgi:hypothetical protein